jgi:taurine dioxygenase
VRRLRCAAAPLRERAERRSIAFPLKVNDAEGELDEADPEDRDVFRTVPLVHRHAVTGRKFLFLGARRILSYIDTSPRVTGLSREQGAELLDALYAHIAQPHFVYLHQWQPGDLLLWDNRACAHRRESFNPDERRLLYGTPIVRSDVLWRAPKMAAV